MKEKDFNSTDLLYMINYTIFLIGLFVIFLMVKDFKIRMICWATMIIPKIVEFIYNKTTKKYLTFF